MPGLKQPDINSLSKYGININNVKDVSYNGLYDYQNYASTGSTTFSFFQVPIGQSGKTLADTNMKLAGQLSSGESFLVTGIEVLFAPASDDLVTADETSRFAFDYYRVMRAPAYLQFNVLNKEYVQQGPLMKFPTAQYFTMDSSMTTGNAVLHSASLMQTAGALHEIVPVKLAPSMSFDVTINFKSVVTVQTDARIGVTLRGYRFRDAQ